MVNRFGLEEYLGSVREVSWISVAIVLIFDLLNLLFFLTQPAALLTVLLPWIFVIGIGIFFIGKQRPVDLGLTIPKILPGILCTITLWLAIQVVFALVLLILEGRLSWGVVPVGYLVDQLIFFAFAEEIIFRGYLFPQFFLKIRKTRTRPLTAVILALLGSQLIFSLSYSARVGQRRILAGNSLPTAANLHWRSVLVLHLPAQPEPADRSRSARTGELSHHSVFP